MIPATAASIGLTTAKNMLEFVTGLSNESAMVTQNVYLLFKCVITIKTVLTVLMKAAALKHVLPM